MPAKVLKLLLLLIVQAYLLQGRESGFHCRNSQQPLRLVHRLDGSRFSSSSHYSQFNASQAKISNDGTDNQNDQAWCPNVPLRQNAMSEWIMVTFPDVKIINNLLTAPRLHKAADSGEQSKQLFIQYRRSEAEQFRNYSMLSFSQGKLQSKSIIKGNTDVKDKKNYVSLKPPLVAKQVRIFPLNPDERDTNVCLKFELFGCPDYQGLLAYSAPQGHTAAGGRANFTDHYYDGRVVRGRLVGGLGQLSDYISSSASPGMDPNNDGLAGLPYVGWDRRQLGSDSVELLFEFDAVRRFRAITVDVNNDFRRCDARLFSRASVAASVGGVYFTGDSLELAVPPDDVNQFTRPVRLPVSGLVGRFVRLRLHFAPRSHWVLLSEVYFDSAAYLCSAIRQKHFFVLSARKLGLHQLRNLSPGTRGPAQFAPPHPPDSQCEQRGWHFRWGSFGAMLLRFEFAPSWRLRDKTASRCAGGDIKACDGTFAPAAAAVAPGTAAAGLLDWGCRHGGEYLRIAKRLSCRPQILEVAAVQRNFPRPLEPLADGTWMLSVGDDGRQRWVSPDLAISRPTPRSFAAAARSVRPVRASSIMQTPWGPRGQKFPLLMLGRGGWATILKRLSLLLTRGQRLLQFVCKAANQAGKPSTTRACLPVCAVGSSRAPLSRRPIWQHTESAWGLHAAFVSLLTVPKNKCPPPASITEGFCANSAIEIPGVSEVTPADSVQGGGSAGRESETTTYVAIIVSILLGAVLLMLAIAFLCLRRRLLRKKQRSGGHAAGRRQSAVHQQAKNAESIHLDFSSGRPAMLINGKAANGSIYTSLPNSEDEEEQRTDLSAPDCCYTYAPASFAQFAPAAAAVSGAAREYASATLYGPQQPPAFPGLSGASGLYASGLGTYARPRLVMTGTGQPHQQPLRQVANSATAATVDAGGLQQLGRQSRPALPGLPRPAAAAPFASNSPPPPVPRFPSDLSIQGGRIRTRALIGMELGQWVSGTVGQRVSSADQVTPESPQSAFLLRSPLMKPPASNTYQPREQLFVPASQPHQVESCSGNTVYACPDADLASAMDCGGVAGVPDDLDGGADSDAVAALEVAPGSVALKERLGAGQFGEVRLAEWAAPGGRLLLVAAKTLRPGAGPQARRDFRREMRLLARLQDPNIVRVLGVATKDAAAQQCILVEFMQHGDLHQFLRSRAAAAAASPEPPLSHGCLIYLAAQIASGMKYLESLQLVHRDLACRNCLLGEDYQVKICDFGMSQPLYSADYCRLDGGRGASLPIRWMAWEAVLHGRFSCRSDVWSFAVTLWEMLTFCREQPFAHLTDQQVVANCQHVMLCNGAAQALPRPPRCPRELFDLMSECWQRDEACRPRFREVHLFLQRHNAGFSPRDGSLLQLPLAS
uniref:Protein kinase domain-containing protein n=1 Tax=Macrostomum lignano TaxID=282301 RepID=A0A1I8GQC0_9PLAT